MDTWTLKSTFRDYKGEIMFVSVTVDEEEHKRVLDFFGIWTTPTFRIANVNVSTNHCIFFSFLFKCINKDIFTDFSTILCLTSMYLIFRKTL